MVPLALIIIGAYRSIFGKVGIQNEKNSEKAIGSQIFLVLFLFNAAGIIALTLKSPVYSSMKATYFLGSLPAFSVFLGLGIMAWERHRTFRRILAFVFGGLFLLTALHIVHIAHSIGFKLGI